MALVVAALVINWAMICITHLKFRRAMQRAGKVTAFQSFAYPLTNWLCLLFLAAILGVMYLTPDIRISVCLIPVWLLILAAGYLLRRKSAPAPVAALEALICDALPGGRAILCAENIAPIYRMVYIITINDN